MNRFDAKRRRRLWLAAGIAAAIALLIWLSRVVMPLTSDRALTQIIDAANSMHYRPLQGRLSGPFLHRPLQSNPDASEERDASARRKLIRLSTRLSAMERTSGNLHYFGITCLLVGKIDRATAAFENALPPTGSRGDVADAVRNSRDAPLLGDLAVAYLERARRTESASNDLAALETAQRAWDLARTPANAWNRALALGHLHFGDATREGWREYLRLDPASPWTPEARMRLAALNTPTQMDSWDATRPKIDTMIAISDLEGLRFAAARFPQQMRVHVEDVLLPQWSNTGAAQHWRAIKAIGEALAEHGEHLISEIVAAVDGATPAKRARLMKAYGDYAAGKLLYEKRQPLAAAPRLTRASQAFAEEGAPVLASLADVFVSSAIFVTERYDESLRIATRGARRLERPENYPSLFARLEWLRGLCNLALARPYESLQSYDRALAAMRGASELDSVAALQNLRGEALEAIGDNGGGLDSRLAAVRTKSEVGGRNKAEQILAGVTRALFAQGHIHIALQFIDLTVNHPQFGDHADFASEVLLLRALILQKLGREAEAKSMLISARAYAMKSGDQRVNASMLADIDAALALNGPPSEPPQQRIARLTAALDHALHTDNHYYRSSFFLHRARALRQAGKASAAEADLRSGLAEVESQRRAISERRVRAMYFASARDLVTDLVALLLDAKRGEEAFDVAEAARSRGLLDSSRPVRARAPLTHDEIAASLRRGETLLSNLALPDRVATWIVTRRGIHVTQRMVGRDALERLLAGPNAESGPTGVALYQALIADADATPMIRCVFVPDPSLPPLTLAVLKDGQGKYLIEKYPIVYAPSATAYAGSAGSDRRRSGAAAPRVLTAAATSFDTTLFPSLNRLPSAEEETERIGRLYGTATAIKGPDLTPERFLAAAAEAEIIHFAGHAVGGRMPTGAALLMAPDASRGDAGLLYAHTIAERAFGRARLVVLSACGVTSRADVDALAVGSIAYAFLTAGVPAVVATVRPVDDAIAAEFMPRLHTALLRERDAARALQSAQLTFIRSSDPTVRDPRNWSPFRLYGHFEE